ncbi:MAG TPA: metal ABC transporter substrate-binding protein [Gaiellaceae bacterium]|nr:metal ABC transporter substrate-binding protein [Gaiellaceae bacterium]
MRSLLALGGLVGVLAAAGCGGGAGGDPRPTVVAAFYPLAWAAGEIAGDRYRVVDLTPPGAEPHDVELSPRDVEAVRNADLVVFAGGGFQPAVEDAVADRDGPSLDVLDGEPDPHVWLDPVRFSATARVLGDALGRPAAGRRFAKAIEDLGREYEEGLRSCQRRTLVSSHAAFGQFAARYGLTAHALAGRSPEAEPGPRELERLVDEVRAAGVTTVFTEPLVSDRLAETVAREAGVEVATLDPIEGLSEERLDAGEDYLSVMRKNLDALRAALGCR